jgi:hypothetical protein
MGRHPTRSKSRHASFGSIIRNGINEFLITFRSLAGGNIHGLLMCGAHKRTRTHVWHPYLDWPQSLRTQAFPVKPDLISG